MWKSINKRIMVLAQARMQDPIPKITKAKSAGGSKKGSSGRAPET
jgi:hypothetical protein